MIAELSVHIVDEMLFALQNIKNSNVHLRRKYDMTYIPTGKATNKKMLISHRFS